jgi:predicted RNase H-like HicB family nuclease
LNLAKKEVISLIARVLQGCHAEGESYAEVIENIEDVIKAHISATTFKY